MMIQSLELSNFRNYERASFQFHPGTNVLYGDNAQGKTNVTRKNHISVISSRKKTGHLKLKSI